MTLHPLVVSQCHVTEKALRYPPEFSGIHYSCVAISPGGGTPLYGLNGDVRPDRVWFSEDFVLNGVSISSIFVLNGVSLHDLMYSLTTEPSQKAKFCQCSAY